MDLDSNFLSASRLYNSHNLGGCSFAGDLSVWRIKSEIGFLSNTSTAAACSWTLRCAYRTEYSRSSNPPASNSRHEEPQVRQDVSLEIRRSYTLRLLHQRSDQEGSSQQLLLPSRIRW